MCIEKKNIYEAILSAKFRIVNTLHFAFYIRIFLIVATRYRKANFFSVM